MKPKPTAAWAICDTDGDVRYIDIDANNSDEVDWFADQVIIMPREEVE